MQVNHCCLCFGFVRDSQQCLLQMPYSMHPVYWMAFVWWVLPVARPRDVSLFPKHKVQRRLEHVVLVERQWRTLGEGGEYKRQY